MKHITLKLTVEELRLLASLASDQLFRREFIDPRMPGYRSNSGEVSLGKALVGRLRLMVEGTSSPARITGDASSSASKRQNGIQDAL
jgi:hypothetical protein